MPIFLKFLPSLKQLLMHMNKITDIKPLCCKEFSNLEVLDLGANKIQQLPNAFVHFLGKLIQLTLSNNDLGQLPHLLGFHKNLRNLSVDGNPLKSIRRTIIDKGTDAILKFLKDKFIDGKDDMIEEWALV